MSVMHVDMYKMVRTAKQSVLTLHMPTPLKCVDLVIQTASVAVRGQRTDLVTVVVMPATLWFMNRTVHTA